MPRARNASLGTSENVMVPIGSTSSNIRRTLASGCSIGGFLLRSSRCPRGHPLTPATNDGARIRQLRQHQFSQDQPSAVVGSARFEALGFASWPTTKRVLRGRLKLWVHHETPGG